MRIFTQYHRASGHPIGTIQTNENDVSIYEKANIGLYEGIVEDTEYVIESSPLTLGIRASVTPVLSPVAPVDGDSITISNLPDPCWVIYEGAYHEITGGSVSGTAKAGRFNIVLLGAYSGSLSVEVPSVDEDNLNTNSKWQAIQTATPAQIDTWLTNNVTNLAEARDVLKILLLAVRKLNVDVKR